MGMAPSAAFAAADTVAAQAEAEGELAAEEGTDTPAEDPAASETPAETPETPAEEPAETPDETPSEETPAETPETQSADPTEVPAAEEAGSGTIVIGETAYATLKYLTVQLKPMILHTLRSAARLSLEKQLMFRLTKILCWLQQQRILRSNVLLVLQEAFSQYPAVLSRLPAVQ